MSSKKLMILKKKLMTVVSKILDIFDINDYYESGQLLISSCPIHDGDNVTAFNLNVDESSDHYGRWFCNTKHCHESKEANDIISLIWLLLEKQHGKEQHFTDVIRFCQKLCDGINISEINQNFYNPDAMDKLLDTKNPKINTNKNISRETVRKFLTYPAHYYLNRGFTKEALDEFDVGICHNPKSQMYNRVVFPVYDENDKYMIGCVGRTINDDPRKWINQKGFNKSNFLYNYGKAINNIIDTETIILVEGQGDVIRLWEAGIKNAVGIFGSNLSDSQEFLLQRSGVSNVIIMTDNDDAGHVCRQKTKEKLKYIFNVYDINLPTNDIGDMSISEINSIIKPQIQGKY